MVEREFGIVSNSNQLEYNYSRILRDTNKKTRDSYLKRFNQWAANISGFNDFKDKLNQIDEGWLDGKYRHATVRQYKATAVYAISSIYDKMKSGDASVETDETQTSISHLSKTMNESQLKHLYQIACDLGSQGERKEIDHDAHLEGNTSSIKDKRFDKSILDAVFNFCGDKERYWLLKSFLTINSKLGLRPIEYKNATLMSLKFFNESDDVRSWFGLKKNDKQNALNLVIEEPKGNHIGSKLILIVKNAKNSHGRACGEYRFLHLDVLSDDESKILLEMMKQFRLLSKNKGDFDAGVIRPLQHQLKYILTTDNASQNAIDRLYKKRLSNYKQDIKNNPNRREPLKKRPTLYSTRHQAVANAKKEGMHPVVIAAAFGHASILTANEHYGNHWHGSGKGVVPHQESINAVVDRLTENQKIVLTKDVSNVLDRSAKQRPESRGNGKSQAAEHPRASSVKRGI